MQVIVPVAGMGTRVRPLTHAIPKVLMPVGGRRVLDFLLDEIGQLAPTRIVFIVRHLGDEIRRYVAALGLAAETVFIEQEECLGLGHAVWLARDAIRPEEPVAIILGDTVFEGAIDILAQSAANVIMVKEVEDPRRFGVVELAPDGETIVSFVEKPVSPPSNLAVVGIYGIRHPAALFGALEDLVRARVPGASGEVQLTDALARMLADGERFLARPIDRWLDCGKFETTLETNRYLVGRDARLPSGAGPGRNVRIVAPVILGAGVELEDCEIGPGVAIGAGCRIRRAILRDSIVGERAAISDIAASGSMIGDDCVVSGGGAESPSVTLYLANDSVLRPAGNG